MINDKVKEILSISISIVILLAIAYFTGFLKDLNINNLNYVFNGVGNIVSDKINSSGIRERTVNANTVDSSGYKGYRTQKISKDLIAVKTNFYLWDKIMNSNKKIVFYVYPSENDNFDSSIKQYLSKSGLYSYYSNQAISERTLKHINVGSTSSDKVCNSFEECNEQRKSAVAKTNMTAFFAQCGKTMCIFNPKKKEYINIKKRDVNEAKKMLNALKNW